MRGDCMSDGEASNMSFKVTCPQHSCLVDPEMDRLSEFTSPSAGLDVDFMDTGNIIYRNHDTDVGGKDHRETYAVIPTRNCLPDDDAARLDFPMFDGLMAYFPNALAEVSRVSKIGNDQHNPGQPMHWARGKSTDHGNKIMRHLAENGGIDSRGVRHSARLAWRALALLQEELERDAGAPISRGSQLAA